MVNNLSRRGLFQRYICSRGCFFRGQEGRLITCPGGDSSSGISAAGGASSEDEKDG